MGSNLLRTNKGSDMKYGRSNPAPQKVREAAIARARAGEDLHDIAEDFGVARWTVAVWCRDKPVVKTSNIANISSMPLIRLDENSLL